MNIEKKNRGHPAPPLRVCISPLHFQSALLANITFIYNEAIDHRVSDDTNIFVISLEIYTKNIFSKE